MKNTNTNNNVVTVDMINAYGDHRADIPTQDRLLCAYAGVSTDDNSRKTAILGEFIRCAVGAHVSVARVIPLRKGGACKYRGEIHFEGGVFTLSKKSAAEKAFAETVECERDICLLLEARAEGAGDFILKKLIDLGYADENLRKFFYRNLGLDGSVPPCRGKRLGKAFTFCATTAWEKSFSRTQVCRRLFRVLRLLKAGGSDDEFISEQLAVLGYDESQRAFFFRNLGLVAA